VRDLGVRDVDHVVVDVEVELRARLEVSLEAGRTFTPDEILHLVLEAEQVDDQLLRLLGQVDLGHGDGRVGAGRCGRGALGARLLRHEGGQLGDGQRRVQFEVRADRGQHFLLAHLVHEDVGLVLHRLLHRVLRLRVAAAAGREEFGAAEVEALLELGQVAVLHLVHLLVEVLLAQRLLNRLVHAHRVQHQADRQQSVHLVSLLVDLQIAI